MTINSADIKLLESERLTDEDSGGGSATGNEVVSGQVNNLFNDISRLDRTLGDVALRKVFAGVQTANTDTYLGAHIILSKDATDDQVGAILFNTESQTDTRDAAQNRLESYLNKADLSVWDLLGDHISGQRIVQLVGRPDAKVPELGTTIHLQNTEDSNDQYIRLTSIAEEDVIFVYASGSQFIDLPRKVLTCEMSAELNHLFYGGQPHPLGTVRADAVGIAEIRNTLVANAAKYFGAKKTTAQVEVADLSVNVGEIFSPIVPTASSEVPVVDVPALRLITTNLPTGLSSINETIDFSLVVGNQTRSFIGNSILVGSVVLVIAGGTYTDNSQGSLVFSSGVDSFSTVTIDYSTGEINVYKITGFHTGTASVTSKHGTFLSENAITTYLNVTQQNRGFSFIFSFADAPPAIGTLSVDFMVLGSWFQLVDRGDGILEGDGTGTVNPLTGSLSITTLEQPDVGTPILVTYQSTESLKTQIIATASPDIDFRWDYSVPVPDVDKGIHNSSVTITWDDGTPRTATSSDGGIISGDATGRVYANGDIEITPNVRIDATVSFTTTYFSLEDPSEASFDVTPLVDTDITITLSPAPAAGTFKAVWTERMYRNHRVLHNVPRTVEDDGLGVLTTFKGVYKKVVGTINYVSGDVVFTWQDDDIVNRGTILGGGDTSGGVTFATAQHTHSSLADTDITISYSTSGVEALPEPDHIVSSDSLNMNLVLNDMDGLSLISNTLLFTDSNSKYVERNGLIFKDVDTETNAGTSVGSINISDVTVILNAGEYLVGSLDFVSGLAAVSIGVFESGFFRTSSAPIKPTQLNLVGINADDGSAMVGSADNEGVITGSFSGTIDYITGFVEVENIGVPTVATEFKYNAVIINNIPLDAEIIGLDPVRLPSDGRVPIFRSGDVMVMHHTVETDIGTPVADQVVNFGRLNIANIEFVGANGLLLDKAQYTEDKAAGTATMGNPLTLEDADSNPLTTPLLAVNRIEHMSLISDVEINGNIHFIAQSAHVFPADETIVSSAVLYGDTFSNFDTFFEQQTWDSQDPNWGNDPIGAPPSASYNIVDNPIEVTNQGSIAQKWALVFTSSTTFNITGEDVGIIGSGSTSSDVTPNNPAQGVPYFTLYSAGFGVGWSTGNVIRFNTGTALNPLWLARVVLAGEATDPDDSFTIQIRGDAD